MAAAVWGTQEDAFGDEWWDGTADSGAIINPPDTDAWNAADLGVTAAWYAGGSDGTRHFHVSIDSAGQWWVSVFNADMSTLLDRWEITGWSTQ